MIANERQQTSDGFGFSTVSSLPFANYLEADFMSKRKYLSEEHKIKISECLKSHIVTKDIRERVNK